MEFEPFHLSIRTRMCRTVSLARFLIGLSVALAVTACSNIASPAHFGAVRETLPNTSSKIAVGGPDLQSLLTDGSFETPLVPGDGFLLFSVGSTFSKWHVVGTSGDIAIVSGTFSQNGFTFPAGCGKQWVDLTGVATTGAGVAQTVSAAKGSHHVLTFSVGNVVDPNGIFGTTSTVNVLVNGVQTFKAVNKKGVGLKIQVWKKFRTTIIAPSNSMTITFVNGDPAGDDNNGLDCIKLN